jgi:isopenicillin-N epimerase
MPLMEIEQPIVTSTQWILDPGVVFLNHGSFGACPRRVLEAQSEWRTRLEREPVDFLVRELEGHLDIARAELAKFVGANSEDIAFVPNATSGVNTVLRSLEFHPGDELLVTDHEYNACRNAIDFVAERAKAKVVVVSLPFPFQNAEEIISPIIDAITSRTRLALIDHVTSQTGLVLPVKRLVELLSQRGIDTLIDGAHAPGMVPLDLANLGATYYTGNCHKWVCAPKTCALLYVRKDRQRLIRPLTISHGANSRRTDRSRFQLEFNWPGTWDPSACLSIPEALRFMESTMPSGWPGVMTRNRALAIAARNMLCEALGISIPCPDDFIGSMASIPLPDIAIDEPGESYPDRDPLQERLRTRHQIEAPIISWPTPDKKLLRISAQLYNSLPQYSYLITALKKELAASG